MTTKSSLQANAWPGRLSPLLLSLAAAGPHSNPYTHEGASPPSNGGSRLRSIAGRAPARELCRKGPTAAPTREQEKALTERKLVPTVWPHAGKSRRYGVGEAAAHRCAGKVPSGTEKLEERDLSVRTVKQQTWNNRHMHTSPATATGSAGIITVLGRCNRGACASPAMVVYEVA